MKKFYFILLLLGLTLFSTKVNAQAYGNEWIDYNQVYLKFPVYKTQVYRINYTTLYSALQDIGISLADINPKYIKIYGRGQEIPLYIAGENDNQFDTNDYIEFYAQYNDGWYDERLYPNANQHPNPYYSNFTDTAYYFLTWGQISGLRYSLETDTNTSIYSEHNRIFVERILRYSGYYCSGAYRNDFAITPYKPTESWMDTRISLGGTSNKSFSTTNADKTYTTAELEYAFAGVNTPTYPHHMRVAIGSTTLTDTIYSGVQYLRYSTNIASTLLGTSTTALSFKSINDQNNSVDYQCVVYAKLKYAHTFTLESGTTYTFSASNLSGAKTIFPFISSTIGSSGDEIILYDLTNHLRIKVVKNGNQLNAIVPNYGKDINCYLTSASQIGSITTLFPINGTGKFTNVGNYRNTNYFIISASQLMNEANNYANYRSTQSPHLYTANAFNINELYDQFAYGIRNNPIAIHNFIQYAYASYNVSPQYLFLIGRAYTSSAGRKTASTFNATLVPTMGSVPSDYAITAGLGDTNEFFCLPTGRLSTSSSQQVQWYLNKVKEFETAQLKPAAWMKQILHFGGGSNASEQRLFASYLESYRKFAEAPYLGAKVYTFLKSNSDPVTINMSDSLRNLINNGVAIMTFFGHAGGTGFDISIDDPETYSNQGKYFILLGNSCYAGDIFSGSNNYSEKFIHLPDKGAIVYISPSQSGNTNILNNTCWELYRNLSQENYGKSIGYCVQKALKSTTKRYGNDKTDYVLHGDPSLIVSPADKPDLHISSNNITTSPEIIRSELDSFTVNLSFINQGKISNDSFYICVERFFPDNTSIKIYKRITMQNYQKTLSVTFPMEANSAIGVNKITITLDAAEEIEEMDETNNLATISFTITSTEIMPTFPYKYAVVPYKRITLSASVDFTYADIGTSNKYVFEIDTCRAFNSLSLQTSYQTSDNGIVEWELPFDLVDSTTYYWRVSKQDKDNEWYESSFQYINGKSGCSQSHFDQYKDNTCLNIQRKDSTRTYDFTEGVYAFNIKTRFFANVSEEVAYENEVYIKRNNVIFDYVQCVMVSRPFVNILVFNPKTGENWVNTETNDKGSIGRYGQSLCREYETNGFGFYMDNATTREDVAIFLENIPIGYYVIAYSTNHTGAHLFTERQYLAWESIGSTQIRSLTANNDYIIYGKKGATNNDPDVREAVGLNNGQFLTLSAEMRVPIGSAKMTTETFGPSQHWGSFHWEMEDLDSIQTDTTLIDIYGIKENGQTSIIYSNLIYPDRADVFNLDNKLDARTYPYTKLDIKMTDNVNRTAPQIKKLLLLYDEVPESAVCYDHFFFHSDTIQQGDSLQIIASTKNVSYVNMSDMLVKYSIIKQNKEIYSEYKRLSGIAAGQILTDTASFNTRELSGENLLRVEFNPNNDQTEKYHYNNYIEVPFYVVSDSINPILDVTFDGTHIIDGEIVSAKPYIQIMVKDENKYLLMNDIEDTAKIKVYLKSPSSSSYQYIPFYADGKEILQYIPANNAQNKCQINYQAELLEDGIYYLRVEANDKSDNASGSNAFVISFEVINKSSITEVFNYPNPFSTRTQFVFTLTGSEVPTFMKIQILTISGKVVKEIDMSELGPIKIGKNITTYAWDGRDNNGNLLANGVYLYRVVTHINGKEVELNSQVNNNKTFKKGFGKMVIIR